MGQPHLRCGELCSCLHLPSGDQPANFCHHFVPELDCFIHSPPLRGSKLCLSTRGSHSSDEPHANDSTRVDAHTLINSRFTYGDPVAAS